MHRLIVRNLRLGNHADEGWRRYQRLRYRRRSEAGFSMGLTTETRDHREYQELTTGIPFLSRWGTGAFHDRRDED